MCRKFLKWFAGKHINICKPVMLYDKEAADISTASLIL